MKILRHLLVLMLLGILAACGGGGGSPGLPTATPKPLTTTAPGDLTVAIGSSQGFAITGGRSPYQISSTNVLVATGSVDASNFWIAGVAGGSVTLTISDAAQQTTAIVVTVPAPTALFSTAPSTLEILNGTTNYYQIFGGVPPYVVNTSGVIARSVVSGANLAITGVVPGTQTVAISDAVGASIRINVTVKAGLFTDAPASLSLASGTSASYSIYGGSPFSGAALYRVNSSLPSVVSASVSGSTLFINAISSTQQATLVITDSVGATTTLTVTVPAAGAILSTAPTNLGLSIGEPGRSYALYGGDGTYTASSSNPAIVSASVSGSTLTIRALENTLGGTANVIVTDAKGSPSLTINVTASAVPFFTTAPSPLAIAAGAPKTFAMIGGTLPYSVVSTHPDVAKGDISGNALVITGYLPGSSSIRVSDARGQTVSIDVVVSQPGTLKTSAPSPVTIATGQSDTYNILGGIPPYLPNSSNLSVAKGTIVNANQIKIDALGSGSATIAVTDSVGATATIAVTVPGGGPVIAFFVSAPDTIKMGAGTSTASPSPYLASGGAQPYLVSSADSRVATGELDASSRLTIRALTVGTTILRIVDAVGASKEITVEVDNNGGTGPSAVKSIEILASSNSLNSAPGSSVSFVVTAKDGSNTTMPAQTVVFAADSGTLTGANPAPVTNAAGTISTVILSPGADASVRNIVVTASTGGVTKSITIPVVGTSLALSGPGAALVGSAQQSFTVKAVDSSGKPIVGASLAVTSKLLNGVSPSTVKTDSSGAATIAFTATVVGTDTLTVAGLGTSSTASVVVSNEDFSFTTPAAGAKLPVSIANSVAVLYRVAGIGVGGRTVTFGATRGALSATTAVTSSDPATLGQASVTVLSDTAGPVTVSAQLGTARSSLTAAFVATVPANLVLQANPAAVLPNVSGTTNQSALTAVVRDAVGNPVQGVVVNFAAITDSSNGSIDPGSATTDANGQATVQFIPGPLSTAANGVQIRGTVQSNPAIVGTASLTVNGEALFISIARSETLTVFDSTTYQKNFSVYVTDANGAPAGNRAVTLSVEPTVYGKGSLVYANDLKLWVYSATSPTTCINEDNNRNGILDTGDVDLNVDGRLQPGIPAAITSSVVTDALGFAPFTLRYGKNYAMWVDTQITAKSLVGGTESKQMQSYGLEMTITDAKAEGSPANVVSPFGTATICTDPN